MVHVPNGTLASHQYDSLWMYGGAGPDLIRGLDHVFDDLFLFNVKSQKWKLQTCVGHKLPPREGHTTTMIKDVMFIIGGSDAPHRPSSTQTVFAINLDTLVTADIYMQNGLNPKSLYGHTAVWNQFRPGEIIIFGGRNEDPMSNTSTATSGQVWRLDTGMNTLPEHAQGGPKKVEGDDFTYMPKYMPKWSTMAIAALSEELNPPVPKDPNAVPPKLSKRERKKKKKEDAYLLTHPPKHIVRRKGPSQRLGHAMVAVNDCWAFMYGGLDIRCGVGNTNEDSWLLRFVTEDEMYRKTVEANVEEEIAQMARDRIAKLNVNAKKSGSGARTRLPREKHVSPLEKFRQGTIEQKLMENKMKALNRVAQRRASQAKLGHHTKDESKEAPRPETPKKPDVAVGRFLPSGSIPSLSSKKSQVRSEYKDRYGMVVEETTDLVEQQSYVSVREMQELYDDFKKITKRANPVKQVVSDRNKLEQAKQAELAKKHQDMEDLIHHHHHGHTPEKSPEKKRGKRRTGKQKMPSSMTDMTSNMSRSPAAAARFGTMNAAANPQMDDLFTGGPHSGNSAYNTRLNQGKRQQVTGPASLKLSAQQNKGKAGSPNLLVHETPRQRRQVLPQASEPKLRAKMSTQQPRPSTSTGAPSYSMSTESRKLPAISIGVGRPKAGTMAPQIHRAAARQGTGGAS
jgi:hypothetical protein